MDNNQIIIQKTNTTPEIIVNYNKKNISIRGKSIPEDAYEFYNILLEQIKDDIEYTLDIYCEFLNSASLKIITFVITTKFKLKEVNWYYDIDDVDIEEKGSIIKEISTKENPDVIFNLIEKK